VTKWHQLVLVLAWVVILTELTSIILFFREMVDWASHNLWVMVIPFSKLIIKRLLALKLMVVLKALSALGWHLSKLVFLKLLKTLSVRYGVFFTQRRWYWARKLKVMFLRRGKQFFRAARHFWLVYTTPERWVILIAFFPAVLLLFLLGLSFNLTRKTMVQKTQETAISKTMTAASSTSKGIRAKIANLDLWTLEKIKSLNPKRRS